MYNFFLAIYKDNKETAISKYHNLALLQSYENFTVVITIHISKWNQNCYLDLLNKELTLVYTYSMISMVVPRPLPLGFGLVVVLDFPGLGLTLTCGLRTPLTTPRPLNGYPRSYKTKSRQCHITWNSFVYA